MRPPAAGRLARTRVIAGSSGKGGVGKTTLTVNLAIALARRGRKAIVEVLVMTPAIAHLLTNDKIFQIPMKLETGRALGMQLLDQALLEAVQRKQIDPDDAYLHAQDKKPFQRFVTDPHLLPKISLVGA